VFGNFTVLNAENINDVEVEFVTGRWVPQPLTFVRGGSGGIHHHDIAFRDYLFYGIAEIRQAFEYPLEKLLEAGFTLGRILVMLDIVVSHDFIEPAEIMVLKYRFTECFDELLISLNL
jgi:hypothetical protein